MKKFTLEQKKKYFSDLRIRWQNNKIAADQDEDANKKWQAVTLESPDARISYYGFYFALIAMQSQGLTGLPYVDAKTFNGWRAAGYQVRTGEHSTIAGITWISGNKKDDEDETVSHLYPKQYALFHKSQVDPIQ